jgi:nicotinamide phosphoribosyltransferase
MNLFPATCKDFYKVGHINQYPEGTEFIYSNLTARSGKHSNVPDSKGITFIGLQIFIMDYLIKDWNEGFFFADKHLVINKYKRRVEVALGQEVDVSHMEALHDLGYLPIHIKALPEGSFVPYRVPMLTIVNTLPEFYWVTNMLESVMSAELWQPINSATLYKEYLRVSKQYTDLTCDNEDHIPFQLHDFSLRGMAGREAAAKSAFAAIACGSKGTDTISALDIAEDYYGTSPEDFIAGSINATEHSVMCAGSKTREYDTMVRLLTKVYPSGNLSIVSDTWDFWNVVENMLPLLKDKILARNGTTVIRPDSGEPVDIICGTLNPADYPNLNLVNRSAEQKGLIQCLWETFAGTTNSKGYKVLNPKIGAIYGDSITLERQEAIFEILEQQGFASSNIVLGIGSYSYQYNTRDTHGMAMKATHSIINGKGHNIFKDPKTDSGLKKSAKGLMRVKKKYGGGYVMYDEETELGESCGELKTVFLDGELVNPTTFNEIRERANEY